MGSTPEGHGWKRTDRHRFRRELSARQEDITGYAYEPWHLRYIGPDAAAAYTASGLTLNQYLAAL